MKMKEGPARWSRQNRMYNQIQLAAAESVAGRLNPLDSVFASTMSNKNRARNPRPSFRIGNTPILSIPEVSDYFGVKHLAIKDESANHFGTHKDRKSLHVVLDTVSRDPRSRNDALCILTAGNAGLSLAKIAAHYQLPITAFVGGESISATLRTQLESACERIVPLDLEDRFWRSDELKRLAGGQRRRVRDVTNGVTAPFEKIIDEICELDKDQLPDLIIVPVGGGELFVGLAQGLKKHGLKTRLIGVTVRKDSAADKLYTKWNPQEGLIKKLTNSGSPHYLRSLDDEEVLSDTYQWLRRSGTIRCEPSSAAAFSMLHKIRKELRPDEKVLVLNTGTFRFEP